MIEYTLINEKLARKYEKEIKTYFKEIFEKSNIVGAIEKNELLGFIWAYERLVNNERRYHINYFIVDSKNRKQGIGKNLIQKIYLKAKEEKIEKIELIVTAKNAGAMEFYKKQEFEIERLIMCKNI